MKSHKAHWRVAKILAIMLVVASSLGLGAGQAFAEDSADCRRKSLLLVADQLRRQYQGLADSPEVMGVHRRAIRQGERPSSQPDARVARWLEHLERTHQRARQNEGSRLRLRELLYRRHTIPAEDVPDSAIELQRRIARQQGHGDIQITPQDRAEFARRTVETQRNSLDQWTDYFLSSDTDHYPFELKVWAFQEITRLQSFDVESGGFLRRTRGTVAAFPELNREALAAVFAERQRQIEAHVSGRVQQSEPFARMYARHIARLREEALRAHGQRGITDGRWVVYPQGSDPAPLVQSLCGRSTGWCTAEAPTAAAHLQDGDFHVYYSLDAQGNPTVPRIAIRMQGSSISEVRGVGANQNLDPIIVGTDILPTRLRTFGTEGERYTRRSQHMVRLTAIERKTIDGQALSREELRFLYEVDEPIEGFGYERDPRVVEIIRRRGRIRQDLADLLEVDPSLISLTREEALRGGMELHYGDLTFSLLEKVDGLRLPRRVTGNVYIGRITSAQDLTLPSHVGGFLDLSGIRNAQGLTLPAHVGGDLNLHNLISAQDLTLPSHVGGHLHLNSLTSAEGLVLPTYVGGPLDLRSLRSAQGLRLSSHVGGHLWLSSLTSAEGLVLPTYVGGPLDLKSLRSAQDLTLPSHVGGHLWLSSLTSAHGLTLPAHVGRDLNLGSLTSAQGLVFPTHVGGDLNLRNLTSAQDLTLPSHVGGFLNLAGIRNAQGLTLPAHVGGDLELQSLSGVRGMTWPTEFRGKVYLLRRRWRFGRGVSPEQLPPHLRDKVQFL